MATKAQMNALAQSLQVRTAKAEGRIYPTAEEISAWSDDEFLTRATEALSETRETAGEKSQLTKYVKRLNADMVRRAGS